MLAGGGQAVWRMQELQEPSAIILEENADKKSDRSDPARERFREVAGWGEGGGGGFKIKWPEN